MAKQTQPTQNLVAIKKIKDGVVYLKNGDLVQIIAVNGINFDLKSEEEQNAIVSGFQRFLHSIDFKIQFFIHSRKVNIDAYLNSLGERKKNETNDLLKIQIEEYINFIASFIENNAIIDKTFFAVVSYSPTIKVTKNSSGILSIFKQQKETPEVTQNGNVQENIEQLRNRAEGVIAGLGQIGLRAIPLEDDELIELFYNLYNPQLIEKKGAVSHA